MFPVQFHRLSRAIPALFALGVGALVTACAGLGPSGVSAQRGEWSFYAPSYLRYVVAAGEVNTVIFGQPFAMEMAAFETHVTGLMDGRPIWASAANYTTRPSDKARKAFWVVVVFNPPINYDGHNACAKSDQGGGPVSGQVQLVAAFCSTTHMLSEVYASAPNVSGPNDPTFERLIHQTLIELLPPRAPSHNSKVA